MHNFSPCTDDGKDFRVKRSRGARPDRPSQSQRKKAKKKKEKEQEKEKEGQ